MAPHRQDQQDFTPGPGPAPGSHSVQYHIDPQLGAPPIHGHSMTRAYGGQQSWVTPPVDDNQYHFSGFNNGGVGTYVNAQAAVQQIPVLQWSNAILAPDRPRNNAWNPTRDLDQGERAVEFNLASPIRPQSIPGYIVTQSQVVNAGINATQVSLHRNLRAPTINESQAGMC